MSEGPDDAALGDSLVRRTRRGYVRGATIVDVAHEANVSIKTVSRVLNREPNVSAATRDLVLATASRLHYTPNFSARSLAGARSYLLALLYDNPSAAYVADLQAGALTCCRTEGYHLIVEPFDSASPDLVACIMEMTAKLRTDGLILTPPLSDHPALRAALDSAQVRYVLISPNLDTCSGPSVRMDEEAAGREMTKLLIGLGHRKIGFVKGHPDHGGSHLRFSGYCDAMREAGLEVSESLVVKGLYSFLSGVEAGVYLLERADRPTAVFAANDDMALGVMSVANRLGLALPRDLSVVGFDDTPTARVVWPQLTTVRQPVAEMAAAAARLLIAEPSTETVPALVLNFEIVIRGSTAPAPKMNAR